MRYGDYELTSDNEYNFIIKKHYISKKTGEPTSKILSYYGKLPDAIENFINVLAIKKWDDEIKEMKDVITLIKEVTECIKS